MALERQISAYDAHFVALADNLEVPVVTGDLGIVRQCPELAISIEDFAA
jgi:predicted nucleic acid-binding protein